MCKLLDTKDFDPNAFSYEMNPRLAGMKPVVVGGMSGSKDQRLC